MGGALWQRRPTARAWLYGIIVAAWLAGRNAHTLTQGSDGLAKITSGALRLGSGAATHSLAIRHLGSTRGHHGIAGRSSRTTCSLPWYSDA